MKNKAYVVEWGDAFIDTDDFSAKGAENTKPIRRITIGWLVCRNQYGWVLATDIFPEEKKEFSSKIFIPHGMVQKATLLEIENECD